jgi:glycosyltransferase involved in cell wall biosynthesis
VLLAIRAPVVLHVRCELKMSVPHQLAMGLATRVVPVSYGIAEVHLRRVQRWLRTRIARRTVVIPNGVELDEDVEANGGWERAKPPERAPGVLILGSLEPRKGQLDFIRECIPRVWRDVAATFVFVGGSKGLHDRYARACRAAAAALDHGERIAFTGYETHIADRIRACRVVALPSIREGLPRILLEAAALGRPAVAFDIPGVGEVIEDGVTGWIVQRGDWVAFARSIALACEDEALSARAGRRAKRRIEDRFSIGLARMRFERVLDEVAGGARGSPRLS